MTMLQNMCIGVKNGIFLWISIVDTYRMRTEKPPSAEESRVTEYEAEFTYG